MRLLGHRAVRTLPSARNPASARTAVAQSRMSRRGQIGGAPNTIHRSPAQSRHQQPRGGKELSSRVDSQTPRLKELSSRVDSQPHGGKELSSRVYSQPPRVKKLSSRVYSQPPRGKELPSAARKETEHAAPGRRSVPLVDDDEATLMFLRTLLQRAGADVRVASSVREGIEAARVVEAAGDRHLHRHARHRRRR